MLYRAAFIFAALALALPPKASDQVAPPDVGVSETVWASGTLARDVGDICARQPAACSAAGDALTLLGQKLATGIDIIVATASSRSEGTSEPGLSVPEGLTLDSDRTQAAGGAKPRPRPADTAHRSSEGTRQ